MKKRWVLVIILAIAVFVITDLIRRREKPIDIEAEQAAIRTLLDEFVAAENAGDIEKIMTLTADGAVVMPPQRARCCWPRSHAGMVESTVRPL